MRKKESSGEHKTSKTATERTAAVPPRKRTFKDFLALAIATCGVGYLPLAPGTWGSVVGVGIYLLEQKGREKLFAKYAQKHLSTFGLETAWTAATLLVILLIVLAGIWAASRVEEIYGRKDPSVVVIDEVAGQLIVFLAVPAILWRHWSLIVAGFLLFRAFDILKPFPSNRVESLSTGLGAMADDVVAGAYGAIALSVLTAIYLLV